MPPRLFQIQCGDRSQKTPAPLLLTRRGQLPNLPSELATRAIPLDETLILQLPIHDWHLLNPNSNQLTTTILPQLTTLPAGSPSVASLIGQRDALLILTGRAASSRQTLANAPGKSLAARVDPTTPKRAISPEDSARLHVVLRSDMCVAITDAPALGTEMPTTGSLKRRAIRATGQNQLFFKTLQTLDADSKSGLVSVQGGADEKLRAECARETRGLNAGGVSIDGLYAGESPETRWAMVDAVIAECTEGLRVLSGGNGAPWEVIAAVREGVDVIESDYPFEMAICGLATSLNVDDGKRCNVRERKWERCRDSMVMGCECFVCAEYSVGYIRHLFEVHEMMGVTLVAAHNLWDYLSWFARLRGAIGGGQFERFAADFERTRVAQRSSGVA